MEAILTIMGAALGLLVPTLLAGALITGVRRTSFPNGKKLAFTAAIAGGVGAWTAAVWGGALTGAFAYHDGDLVPRVLLPLVLPVALALPVIASRDVRTVLDHIPLPVSVGVQAFRLAGAAFLAVVALGILPSAFVIGGFGDLATGTLAIVAAILLALGSGLGRWATWAFTAMGLIDLTNVAILLLGYYPIWHDGALTSAPLTEFSLVMIPALAAPMALILHGIAVRSTLQATASRAPELAPAK